MLDCNEVVFRLFEYTFRSKDRPRVRRVCELLRGAGIDFNCRDEVRPGGLLCGRPDNQLRVEQRIFHRIDHQSVSIQLNRQPSQMHETPLFVCVSKGNLDTAMDLMRHGANPCLVSPCDINYGETTLQASRNPLQ